MPSITILCVEDEPEVREAILRDLEPFGEAFQIEAAEDVADARDVLRETTEDGVPVGLVLCDHVLPGDSGVDFLVQLNQDPETRDIRKVLITGQAGHEDTIRAINEGGLHQYIAKPWAEDQLVAVVRDQLTEYVLATVDDPLPYVNVLDGPRLLEAASRRLSDR